MHKKLKVKHPAPPAPAAPQDKVTYKHPRVHHFAHVVLHGALYPALFYIKKICLSVIIVILGCCGFIPFNYYVTMVTAPQTKLNARSLWACTQYAHMWAIVGGVCLLVSLLMVVKQVNWHYVDKHHAD